MFDSLSEGFGSVFRKLKSRGVISEKDLNAALSEMRDLLLEADVARQICDQFIKNLRTKADGRALSKSVSPSQLLASLVFEELQNAFGEDENGLNLSGSTPISIMMVGLQGVGKTTSCVKLGLWAEKKVQKKAMLVSLDETRPAAREQLAVFAEKAGIASLPIIEKERQEQTVRRALDVAKLTGTDFIIFDTAGRQHIDEAGLEALKALKAQVNPREILLCADAMTGQDASNIAQGFQNAVGLTGIILTRMDGDARGGAALSMRGVTGCPIRFFTTGEKIEDIETFHAERMAKRILGMGDIDSLIEKIRSDEEDTGKTMEEAIKKGYNLEDMAAELRRMRKMGGLEKLVGMLPGKTATMIKKMPDISGLNKQEAIISSMTPFERRNPAVILASRKRRIANGAGTSLQDVNKLLKQHLTMSKMMKRMSRLQASGRMGDVLPSQGGFSH